MGEEIVNPAKLTLSAQLDSVRFLAGIEDGRWDVQLLDWPYLFVRVIGLDPSSGYKFAHDFRLECEGFPDPGPLVERWDFKDEASHGTRPPAPGVGSPGFIDALKEWQTGIYRAWSRSAASHNEWATKRPDEAWHRQRTITFIMEHLYELVSEQAVWLAAQTQATNLV